ncbi:hypothetical protein [Shewanella sp. CG12_big_fil_rev_8_21_14_0_65_47_15]|uniref:hypothetical protein n=1 Tax=Shewanella sp. CG12_big_fil_rev_8_21_14_0_65_47_15 TaxID=1975537 RepID=UPI000CB5F9E6|nr:hypothetical protein [Shewanella sp. CG12_big_fil_rev_8_21_14_0_65_47_15]PIW61832.1 MAG: hypothetical protein COW15_06530 [Shewanella sp. CG12_big_fil_rev_8_21_14_0_65_47_15]
MKKISFLSMSIVLALTLVIGLAVDLMVEFKSESIFMQMNIFSFKLLFSLLSMFCVYLAIAVTFNLKLLPMLIGKDYPSNYFKWSKFRLIEVLFLFNLWSMGDLKYFTILIVNFALVELIHLYLVYRSINNDVESTI